MSSHIGHFLHIFTMKSLFSTLFLPEYLSIAPFYVIFCRSVWFIQILYSQYFVLVFCRSSPFFLLIMHALLRQSPILCSPHQCQTQILNVSTSFIVPICLLLTKLLATITLMYNTCIFSLFLVQIKCAPTELPSTFNYI